MQKNPDSKSLPKEILSGLPVITITGKQELVIENYQGIIEYTDSIIRIKTKTGKVTIYGNHLKIIYYTNDEMLITGIVGKIEYL